MCLALCTHINAHTRIDMHTSSLPSSVSRAGGRWPSPARRVPWLFDQLSLSHCLPGSRSREERREASKWPLSGGGIHFTASVGVGVREERGRAERPKLWSVLREKAGAWFPSSWDDVTLHWRYIFHHSSCFEALTPFLKRSLKFDQTCILSL